MQLRNIVKNTVVYSLLALLAAVQIAQAGADYLVIQREPVEVGDGYVLRLPTNVFPFYVDMPIPTNAVNPFTKTFRLPADVDTSDTAARSAILQFSATVAYHGVNSAYNEVYLNPLTAVCTDAGVADTNQEASIHLLDVHAATQENHVHHRAFSSTRLQPGVACTDGSACTVSGLCQKSVCTNLLMMCARDVVGVSAGGAVNALDDFTVHSMTLHFKRR
jgi:hypothetical protein